MNFHFVGGLLSSSLWQYSLQTMVKHEVDIPYKKATFGMGCFWSGDCVFGVTRGVLRTRVGYAGGEKLNPAYKNMYANIYFHLRHFHSLFNFVLYANLKLRIP